jgi:eukaryotic-like serine/threonine-protein kinase
MAKERSDRGAPTAVESPRKARVSAVSPIALPSGRFHDEGELGHGGRSMVHLIYDKTLLRHSAMKVLSARLQPYLEDRQRFIEEAQITGQLDHPNIVPIHELSLTSDGGLYFTMKLVEGATMEEMLRDRDGHVRQFDWVAPFLEILVKVCDAVAFAHSRGVIHRDLKPGNLMIGNFGQVYVMDWGMAKLMHGRHEVSVGRDRKQALDREGEVLGTPAYMSPEQAFGRHEATDERSDIFALGATLYHILTGHPPYDAEDTHSQLDIARSCFIRPPEQMYVTRHLPRELCRIAMKAMSLDPTGRYQTATALKNDLLAQLRGGADLPRCIFAPGDLVMREGDHGDAAYIIVEGRCRAFKTIDGEEVELRTMGPGEVFGETAILSSKPRTASVQALETLILQVVTPEELEEGVGMRTGLGKFVRTLAERFREVDERLSLLEASLVTSEPDE